MPLALIGTALTTRCVSGDLRQLGGQLRAQPPAV